MSISTRAPPGLIFGPGSLVQLDKSEALEILSNVLPKHHITMLDTARLYEGSEAHLSELGVTRKFKITTKVLWAKGKREEVLQSAKESFEALKLDKVEVYLLHAPDPTTPIEETTDAIQELYKQGRFEKFGLSNFNTDQVLACYNYAKQKGYVLPTIYQSHYNLLYRSNEERLFPTLRSLGISIQAYSPVSGGFLLKSPEDFLPESDSLKGGRWDTTNSIAQIFHGWYNKPSRLEYLRRYIKLSEEFGLSRTEVAYRWIKYHSDLDGNKGDVLIIGSRNKKQLLEVLGDWEKGPLDDALVKRLNEMEKEVRGDVVSNN